MKHKIAKLLIWLLKKLGYLPEYSLRDTEAILEKLVAVYGKEGTPTVSVMNGFYAHNGKYLQSTSINLHAENRIVFSTTDFAEAHNFLDTKIEMSKKELSTFTITQKSDV